MKFLLFIILFIGTMFSQTQRDTVKITSTAMDYVEGWYTSDAARMDRALHFDLAKRKVTSSTSISEESVKIIFVIPLNGLG